MFEVFSTDYNYARCLYEMSGDSHQDFYSREVTGSIVKLFCLFSFCKPRKFDPLGYLVGNKEQYSM